MLSSEGGDLGLAESGGSISVISEGVLGLLALLAFLDGPRDGLHMVENAFRQVSMLYTGRKGHREELCIWTRVKEIAHVWLLIDSRKEEESRFCDDGPCRVPIVHVYSPLHNVNHCNNALCWLRATVILDCSFYRHARQGCVRPAIQK